MIQILEICPQKVRL